MEFKFFFNSVSISKSYEILKMTKISNKYLKNKDKSQIFEK